MRISAVTLKTNSRCLEYCLAAGNVSCFAHCANSELSWRLDADCCFADLFAMLLSCQALAAKAEGYDARDLAVLLDRALHAALARRVSSTAAIHPSTTNSSAANGNIDKLLAGNGADGAAADKGLLANGDSTGWAQQQQRQQQQQQQQLQQQQIEITEEDLQVAFTGFVPAAFWNVASSASKASTAGQLEGWEDVGGLQEAVAALQEALVLPSKYAALVARAPLRLRTGLLLYGPPGGWLAGWAGGWI